MHSNKKIVNYHKNLIQGSYEITSVNDDVSTDVPKRAEYREPIFPSVQTINYSTAIQFDGAMLNLKKSIR